MNVKLLTKQGQKIDRFAYVRGLMAMHGLRPCDVARATQKSRAMVSKVIRGRDTSHDIKQYISDKLGADFRELWGHEARPRKAA